MVALGVAGVIGGWQHMHSLPIPQNATKDTSKGKEDLLVGRLGNAHLAHPPRDCAGWHGYHLGYIDRTGGSGVCAAGLDCCRAGLNALRPYMPMRDVSPSQNASSYTVKQPQHQLDGSAGKRAGRTAEQEGRGGGAFVHGLQ